MRRGLPPKVVAEGVAGGWPWVLEASRAAQSPYPVYLTMRGRDRCSGDTVALDDQPISFAFAQDCDSDASALFGLVASEVESIVVAPLCPVRAAGQRAEIRALDDFGRFFVVGFEAPVEMARGELQPAERFDNATTMALNMALSRRRQDAEAIEVGRGNTPEGRRWRLRVWRERPQTPLLDDGAELDAQLVRTAAVENDYFLAFVPRQRHVLQLVAVDERHRVLISVRVEALDAWDGEA